MMETSALSSWLTSLLRPLPAPPPAPSASAPVEPAIAVEPALLTASGPHPNLVALYDRARARESALVQERLAQEPKLMAAFGLLGGLLIGAAIAANHLVWGLTQWHSPWHVALVALPNVVATVVLLRGAVAARGAIASLSAERKFPFAAQQGLNDPLGCIDKDPDGWLTALVQDVHAANNAHELALKKQQERFAQLVRLLTRLALVLAVQAGYNAALQQAALAAPRPAQPTVGASPAPVRAVPTATPQAVASPVATPTPAPTPTPTPAAQRVRRTLSAATPRPAALPVATAKPAATAQPIATPLPTTAPTAKPTSAPSPAVRTLAPTAAPVAPEKKPAAPAQPAVASPVPAAP